MVADLDSSTDGRGGSANGDSGHAAAALLLSARRALAGELAVPPARVSRAAAVLGRGALESIIAEECRRIGVPARAKGRTRLICMRVLSDAVVARRAGLAWARLSNACHHHSYELSPSAVEVAHLLDLVDQTLASTRGASPFSRSDENDADSRQ